MDIKNIEGYEKLDQRVAHPSAWLDEKITDLTYILKKALTENGVAEKDRIILAVLTYLNGVADGNRFVRPNPYNAENPALPEGEGSRIHY